MADNQITKEEIKKLMEIPGKARGQVLLTDLGYVKEEKGEKGVGLLKKKIKEWGIPIDYDEAKPMKWYPVGFRAISLLAIKEVFGWGDKEIEELGKAAPKFSFIVKMLFKTFLSLERGFKESSKYWEKHYSVGELVPAEINEEKKYLFLHLKNFKIHPILCVLYAGYFYTLGTYMIKGKNITVEETKCMFRGDPYHEFVVRWE